MSPAWTMKSLPRKASTASGRNKPWVSEMSPIRIMNALPSSGMPAGHTLPPVHSCAARRKVSMTGRTSTSRRLHQPAASASAAPLSAPASGTHHGGFQWNSNT